jgi:hypothetical protein
MYCQEWNLQSIYLDKRGDNWVTEGEAIGFLPPGDIG